jgi:hypothetical protein
MIQSKHVRLVFCGAAALFWELAIIRWQGCCLRVVAYYTNFVLIAAFFGLGFGSLLVRFPIKLHRWIFPALALSILSAVYLSGFATTTPRDSREFIWVGGPSGVTLRDAFSPGGTLPLWFMLGSVYVMTASVFVIFGHWIGTLFKSIEPLKAYTLEICGSILGILAFALFSYLQLTPVAWFLFGAVLVLAISDPADRPALRWQAFGFAAVFALLIFFGVRPYSSQFKWSPYYKIDFQPIVELYDTATKKTDHFAQPVGYSVTVNNDYHQMMLDLRDRPDDGAFFREWRKLYAAPYSDDARLPPGPILIVGAGTGNDVAAALHSTKREIYAVDIDPTIVGLGKEYNFAHPYDDPRVHVVINDARSFFQSTDLKFAQVVFGFLDSHTLLSSFSSLRLDNFVYTQDSFNQVQKILLPGGGVVVTFASVRSWIHLRMIDMMDQSFDARTQYSLGREQFVNGTIYRNFKAPLPAGAAAKVPHETDLNVSTDDWPFLYLQSPSIPQHYRFFLIIVLTLGLVPLLTLPRGERSIKLPYFCLGAAFFLLETSNVVSLSLLYGSTWTVNVVVFTGILALVLLGNLVTMKAPKINLSWVFAAILVSLTISYLTPVSALLAFHSPLLKAACAIAIFLGPVFFASLVFAQLIQGEEKLYQAYGSNVLGAVVGGAFEYFSLMLGFKFLICFTLLFYLGAFVLMSRTRKLRASTA